MTYQGGAVVEHPRFGQGTVEFDKGETVLVRFENNTFQECLKSELRARVSASEAVDRLDWHPALEVLARVQAEAIISINDTWGVFSRSSIALLPHQLWVCKRINERWPTHWLVADDVGLGKTIEAGLILWPLISRARVQRVLIMCPASLTEQWQYRLREMFDLRFTVYQPDSDKPRLGFWETHPQVIASMHTLRDDRHGRHERMLTGPGWDLVVVDEAHHLNYSEDDGPTLGYALVQQLVDHQKVTSMVFFTGTPHRGKNYGFLALLRLLRPDLFDPKAEWSKQLKALPQVMIRNNKQNVTDLRGQPLFHKPSVRSQSYSYSPDEAHFYELLTRFIEGGLAYSRTLDRTSGQAVQLVLIAMQKLASSSVAAIRRALKGRLARIRAGRRKLESMKTSYQRLLEARETLDQDVISAAEEELAQTSAELSLMKNEEPHLEQLIEAANQVRKETKVETLLELIEADYEGRQLLFFTEYKATQSLVLSELWSRYGDGCAAFINGDNRADEVRNSRGDLQTLNERRESAAERFNAGRVRFLISTEAGGEGIDLQERCHTLVHIDMPWNPMRLHQRVGRVNRYGQTRPVEVVLLHNPETVESRIWAILNQKLEKINQMLREVMDDPEDMQQLVLGMAPANLFEEIFAEAQSLSAEQLRSDKLSKWFDSRSASFGGESILKVVRELVGNVSKFDFQSMCSDLPRLDLPDLKPFLNAVLTLSRRKVVDDQDGLSFKTPEGWMRKPGVPPRYDGLLFDRRSKAPRARERIVGVGHPAMDLAIDQARALEGTLAACPGLSEPLTVFRIRDRVTGQESVVRFVLSAVEGKGSDLSLLRDWELLDRLNQIHRGRLLRLDAVGSEISGETVRRVNDETRTFLEARLAGLQLPFRLPEVSLFAFLWPLTPGEEQRT